MSSRTKDQVMESQISGIDGNKGQQVSDPGTGFVASRVRQAKPRPAVTVKGTESTPFATGTAFP